ncbi:hypothetical protein J437_LFUL014390 [Ladona fulva]|uniref:Uncharacterized protein n=1 Tax=Ladona fulva TaxID=123851 RepID=A0A8K0KLU5_LADFU|nr:hypothetical protein J437_LFUL014390 [Ladona fulva]
MYPVIHLTDHPDAVRRAQQAAFKGNAEIPLGKDFILHQGSEESSRGHGSIGLHFVAVVDQRFQRLHSNRLQEFRQKLRPAHGGDVEGVDGSEVPGALPSGIPRPLLHPLLPAPRLRGGPLHVRGACGVHFGRCHPQSPHASVGLCPEDAGGAHERVHFRVSGPELIPRADAPASAGPGHPRGPTPFVQQERQGTAPCSGSAAFCSPESGDLNDWRLSVVFGFVVILAQCKYLVIKLNN